MENILTADELRVVRENGFNEHGLRFSIEELQRVIPQDLSMEALSQYVDAVTFVKVRSNDASFFDPQLQELPVGRKVHVSATGLGNLAYVALFMKDHDIRSRAATLFHQILSGGT